MHMIVCTLRINKKARSANAHLRSPHLGGVGRPIFEFKDTLVYRWSSRTLCLRGGKVNEKKPQRHMTEVPVNTEVGNHSHHGQSNAQGNQQASVPRFFCPGAGKMEPSFQAR